MGGAVAVATARAAARQVAAAPAPEPEVFTGNGRLRVGVKGVLTAMVAVANGESMGEVPVDKREMKSGRYTLLFSNAELDQKGRCENVKVTNEKTTRVIYDFQTGSCAIE
jgi:hypothetical protein